MHEYIVYYTYKPLYGIRDLLLYRWVDPKKLILSNGKGSLVFSTYSVLKQAYKVYHPIKTLDSLTQYRQPILAWSPCAETFVH